MLVGSSLGGLFWLPFGLHLVPERQGMHGRMDVDNFQETGARHGGLVTLMAPAYTIGLPTLLRLRATTCLDPRPRIFPLSLFVVQVVLAMFWSKRIQQFHPRPGLCVVG